MKDSDINALIVVNNTLTPAAYTVTFVQFIKVFENLLHVTNVRKLFANQVYKGIYVQFIKIYKTFLRAINVKKVLHVQIL